MTSQLNSVSSLKTRLHELHSRTRETPQFNPVFQLSLELNRALESGKLSLVDMHAVITELEQETLANRALRLHRQIAPIGENANLAGLAEGFETRDFTAFCTHWEEPKLHAVFTAHPTFLLTPDQTKAVAIAAESGAPLEQQTVEQQQQRSSVTLDFEHGEAMRAISNGQNARDTINRRLLDHAATHWPDQWHDFTPMPLRFASWVGYDMDGRTDIKWHVSIGFRLSEKAERLSGYVRELEAIDPKHSALAELRAARDYANARATDFSADLSEPAALSAAANRLTADDPHKLLSLKPFIDGFEEEARSTDRERAIALKTLAAAMRADGLGMGWIHFRVNSSQLHNAIRRRIDPENELDLSSRGAIARLRDALADTRPLRSNFAALAIESSTAIRQFIAMAQILNHIDADAPIRMLIAECEQPATVLAALYFARLFGISDKVDVSPLFETESALEHGGRFLDALLAEPAYQAYARERGRVAIQTGFSDAGRFVGQIPASLAIERLQGRLAAAMTHNELRDVAALIFNTHGESMGRGAHPSSFSDRLDWALSPWARRRFTRSGIALEPEASFQGGDGYLYFATPDLALATLTRICEYQAHTTNPDAPSDPFYHRTDLSLDFYRAVRDEQHQYLESKAYSRAITAFGLGLLNTTGSRKSRRQSDLAADREMSLRQIRAIPHNSVLQQLGYPINVIAGLGNATEGNYEEIAAMLSSSVRGRQLLRLVRAANALSSIKTVAAYGELFNSAYWASRPYRGTEPHISAACEGLAGYLAGDDRTGVFRRLASLLRVDALKLHRLLAFTEDESPVEGREDIRRTIGVLQALRLALLQHMFIKAIAVPAFSQANDISRQDVLEMVFSLRIDDALAQLRRAYPVSFPKITDFDLDEPSDYPDSGRDGYEQIHRDFIDPIAEAQQLNLQITIAIANVFGAHG